ncbi:hypothetical protein [Flammeovirga pacifica]|uniref:Uncharacterized protein n=1 Tax=Flammeovirga pacifica TaxID=915059 RepID=A0A1S1YV61_FLAPC|nr:hypothetical protein [Flammeovirga pacifica]OHX64907.1 hypothetical protein NH26_00380 [Flammeovirga pacifica]
MNKKPNLSAIEIYSEKVADAISDEFFSDNDYITGIQITKLTNIESVNLFVLKRIFENWQKEAIRIQSPYFDYSAEAVRESLSHLMNALSKNIYISRIHFLPLLQKAIRDVLILTFSPEIFFDEFFGVQGMKIPLKNYLIPMFGYIKIHPKLVKEIQNAIEEEAGINIKRTEAINIAINIVRKHPELMEDPQEIIAAFNEIVPVGIFELHPGFLDEPPVAKVVDDIEEDEPAIDIQEFSSNVVSFEVTKEENNTITEEEEASNEVVIETSSVHEDNLPEEDVKEENTLFEEPAFSEPEFKVEHKEEPEVAIDDIVDASLKSFSDEDVKEDNTSEFEDDSIQEFVFETIEEPEVVAQETTVESIPVAEETTQEEVISPFEEEEVTSQILATAEKENESNGLLDQFKSESIKENMNLNDRFLFQKELFGGDQSVMNEAINRIDNCEDYTAAIGLIKSDYAVKYDWDFTSDAVVSFISLVDNKF